MTLNQLAVAAAALYTGTHAFAHSGHGAHAALHWHATDTFGLLVVGSLAAAAVWLARK
ncbi:hypothetical protein [Caenimonas sp. SL110]|uniref:hypothetical protein n=1 Tax=Caenimonas sp. SL110 TaxID=1450524 RepID=UPI000AD8B1D3|nr:hypothetical protein [Caenimonas sp. SL110]